MNKTRRIAIINDLSGLGKCSLSVAMPILSVIGYECCVIPTAILSNHTGYKDFFFDDYTPHMSEYISKWKNLNLEFDAVYTGFLGSEGQFNIVEDFFREYKKSGTKIVVDPVMGDNGVRYSTYSDAMCKKMSSLIEHADIVTPNVTEACMLASVKYSGDNITEDGARAISERIAEFTRGIIIITGIKRENKVINYIYENGSGTEVSYDLVPTYYSGMGDIFSSIVCGYMARGISIHDTVKAASRFCHDTAIKSHIEGRKTEDGVYFEPFLGGLLL